MSLSAVQEKSHTSSADRPSFQDVGLSASITLHGAAVALHGVGTLSRGSTRLWQMNADLALAAVRPHGEIVVDLTNLRFGDDSGITWLIDTQDRCRSAHKKMSVAGAPPEVYEKLSHDTQEVLFYSDFSMALARAARRSRLELRRSTPAADEVDYQHLEPLFHRMASYPPESRDRKILREQIVQNALPLAEHIAARFANRGEPRDDLLQVARLGLVRAVDRFDADHGTEFLSFAIPTIMGEVRKHFRDHTWSVRVPRPVQETLLRIRPVMEDMSQRLGRKPTPKEIAAECDLECDIVVEAMLAGDVYHVSSIDTPTSADDPAPRIDGVGTEESGYKFVDEYLTVKPLLARLPERDREVLRMRFCEDMTQAQIARQIGVSQMQVSRILSRTLKFLREESLTTK